MAQTLTDSVLLKAQGMIEEAFSGNTPSKYPFYEPAMSAAAILMNNDSFGQEVLTTGGKHKGFEVNWLTAGSSTIAHNGTPAGSSQACTISSHNGATSDAKLYDNNMAIIAEVAIDDDLSGNLFGYEELVANRFMKAFKDLRGALNTKIINFLDTNKTPINNDSSLPSSIVYNATTDIFEVDTTAIDLQSPRGLTDLDALAMNNDLGSWMYLTGRSNFYNSIVDAQYDRLNDDMRHVARFFDPAYNIYTDPRSLDATIASQTTFIVGEGTYAFWDYVPEGRTVVPTQIEDNKWEYTVNDPVLMVNTPSGLRPLRYNVFYTRECSGVNKTISKRVYTHKFEINLLGGLHEAPASEDTHTGILRIQGVGV